MIKSCLQIIEVVIVCFLQLLPDCRDKSSLSIMTPQVTSFSPAVHQIPSPELVRFDQDAVGVVRRYAHGLLDGVVHLAELGLGPLTEVIHPLCHDFGSFVAVSTKRYIMNIQKDKRNRCQR